MNTTRRLSIAVSTLLAALLLSPVTAAHADPQPVTDATRQNIQMWAEEFIDVPDEFDNDCTMWASKILWAGGIAPTDDWTANSSDTSKLASRTFRNPGPTKAAASANDFTDYLTGPSGIAEKKEITWSDNTAAGAMLGDLIAYDWDPPRADGHIDHIAVVTGFTSDGYPLVSQHSPTRFNRGWSFDPSEGKWIEESHSGAKVYLLHLR